MFNNSKANKVCRRLRRALSARVLPRGHSLGVVVIYRCDKCIGDQDIHIEMGGALPGDNYPELILCRTPGNDNRWINLAASEGRAKSWPRAAAIRHAGTKVTFKENDVARSVFTAMPNWRRLQSALIAATPRDRRGSCHDYRRYLRELAGTAVGRCRFLKNIAPNRS